MKKTNSAERTIGEIVAADYRTARIFEKHGIDFCCGGKIALGAICVEKGLDLATLTAELAAVESSNERSQNYTAWALPFLTDYIVNTHHAYLKANDPLIETYTLKIANVHGTHHPELIEIAALFAKIATELPPHLREEEEVFFPALKRAEAARIASAMPEAKDRETIRVSLQRLQREHEEVGDAIHTIRRLARDYALPDDACNTFMLTYQKLKEFEDDLHMHVHLENNILFPKAAALLTDR